MKYINHTADGGRQIVPQDFSNLSDTSLQITKAIAAMVYGAIGWIDENGNEMNDYRIVGGNHRFTKTSAVAMDLMVDGHSNTSSSQELKSYPILNGHRGDGCILYDWDLYTLKKCSNALIEPKNLVFRDMAVDPQNLYGLDNQNNVNVHHEFVCQQMTTDELRAIDPPLIKYVIDLDDYENLVWMKNFATIAYVNSKIGFFYKPDTTPEI